ncbi:ABC-type glycerol-3-phosphate transport system substrate-binding protein [Paenibacillus taihuensis]|uniref:ABC-type glycerol-3-phosphate transport system substrate-binding protein n=1 Tax=Paenibacillus taihuensis TaxID=1156355 RepID=A0A3D9SDH4_9BACL|nr:ABC transporter substrate-binding protein [Paenibacillus taihuensis]REE92919.1 ABC-type glycerol-3-phosphate transport system substrate-binding protein [Paenibacillus taihuensis]
MEVRLSSRFLIVFLLVWPLLGGCTDKPLKTSGGVSSAESLESGNAEANPVTIDFWFAFGGEYKKDFMTNVVIPFEKKYPGIKVNMTFVGTTGNTQASDKLLTAIAAYDPPDVALFDRFLISSWADKGALTDLTGYVEASQINPSDYYEATWKEVQYKNGVYALPWGTDTRGMYYNKTLMKEAGLDPDKPPATIEELDAMAAKMFKKNANGSYSQVGFIPWLNQGFLYTQGWNWGGQWEKDGELVPNDPKLIQALEWMTWYAKTYNMQSLDSFMNLTGQSGMNAFMTGKVGFVYDGNWLLNDLRKYTTKFEWGVAPMPAPSGQKPSTWAGGWSFVIPKGAKHEKEAWAFIKFVTSKEGVLQWARRQTESNDITAMPAANKELHLEGNPNLKVFLDQMPKAYTRPVSPVEAFLWNETFRIQDLAINGKGTPQELFNQLKRNVNAELAKLRQ